MSGTQDGKTATEAAPFGFEDAAIALAGSGAFPALVAAAARAMLEQEFDAARVAALITAIAAWQGGAAIPDALEPLAQRLLIILYTGETASTDPRASLGYYPWALAWHVLHATKTPGLCGSGFGDWTRA
jgi:hypothetical protein